MTREEKELLLKDLCARLPYKPRIMYYYIDNIDGKEYSYSCNLITHYIDELYSKTTNMSYIKPYLRPMSSMTEEEKEELWELLKKLGVTAEVKRLDWLNAHHFDYRGLIDKGLALEAPKDMYKEIEV